MPHQRWVDRWRAILVTITISIAIYWVHLRRWARIQPVRRVHLALTALYLRYFRAVVKRWIVAGLVMRVWTLRTMFIGSRKIGDSVEAKVIGTHGCKWISSSKWLFLSYSCGINIVLSIVTMIGWLAHRLSRHTLAANTTSVSGRQTATNNFICMYKIWL